jgi:hypothetical protein
MFRALIMSTHHDIILWVYILLLFPSVLFCSLRSSKNMITVVRTDWYHDDVINRASGLSVSQPPFKESVTVHLINLFAEDQVYKF